MALKESTKDYHMSLVQYFKEKQAEWIAKYVIAARKQEMSVFEKFKTIQFATVQLENNKLLWNLIKKTGVQNPKALVYLTIDNKFALVNNQDDLVDLVEDIMDGSSTSLKYFKDSVGSEIELNQFFTPGDMSIFTLMLKHLISFFDSFKSYCIYGLTLFLVNKYAGVEFLHSGIAMVVMILVYSIVVSIGEGRNNGLFI